jgi:hypothetical protein
MPIFKFLKICWSVFEALRSGSRAICKQLEKLKEICRETQECPNVDISHFNTKMTNFKILEDFESIGKHCPNHLLMIWEK